MEFKLGRLYFRYIQRSILERFGYDKHKIARELEALGYIQILEGEHYIELKTMPRKRELIERLIDKNQLEAPLMGKVTRWDGETGEILTDDGLSYLFDSGVVHGGPLRVGERVIFNTAYTTGHKIRCARNIKKQE